MWQIQKKIGTNHPVIIRKDFSSQIHGILFFLQIHVRKDFFTRFSKQVLLFGICGFKNCKIESEVVNILVGHSVFVKTYTFTERLFYASQKFFDN